MALLVLSRACAAHAAQAHDHFRLNGSDLPQQKRHAGGDFVFFRQCDFPAGGTSPRWRCTRRCGDRPMASIICVSSCPARPTKGSPCKSSSWPGPSPTNISSAWGLPAPKTILLRWRCSLQRVQSPRSLQTRSSVSPATRSTDSNSEGRARDLALASVGARRTARRSGAAGGDCFFAWLQSGLLRRWRPVPLRQLCACKTPARSRKNDRMPKSS